MRSMISVLAVGVLAFLAFRLAVGPWTALGLSCLAGLAWGAVALVWRQELLLRRLEDAWSAVAESARAGASLAQDAAVEDPAGSGAPEGSEGTQGNLGRLASLEAALEQALNAMEVLGDGVQAHEGRIDRLESFRGSERLGSLAARVERVAQDADSRFQNVVDQIGNLRGAKNKLFGRVDDLDHLAERVAALEEGTTAMRGVPGPDGAPGEALQPILRVGPEDQLVLRPAPGVRLDVAGSDRLSKEWAKHVGGRRPLVLDRDLEVFALIEGLTADEREALLTMADLGANEVLEGLPDPDASEEDRVEERHQAALALEAVMKLRMHDAREEAARADKGPALKGDDGDCHDACEAPGGYAIEGSARQDLVDDGGKTWALWEPRPKGGAK